MKRRRRGRRALVSAFAVIGIAVLAACGGAGDANKTTTPGTSASPSPTEKGTPGGPHNPSPTPLAPPAPTRNPGQTGAARVKAAKRHAGWLKG